MHVVQATNVNVALHHGLIYLDEHGIEEDSRNGKVLVAPGPVATVYSRPWERVLFSPLRDANPFFHVMEALWMLAGRDDLAFPMYFNSRFGNFSDNGTTVHGAYGKRWRNWFGYDQLFEIANELKIRPDSRRCVLAMWDASLNPIWDPVNMGDWHMAVAGGKDVPCNTQAYFDVRGGKLNMTVCCRSNDIWWGAYGANAVHFSVLQEYMAALVGVEMGTYTQISNNFHLYTNVVPRLRIREFAQDALKHNYYAAWEDRPHMVTKFIDHNVEYWHPMHLNNWIENDGHINTFLFNIAGPMRAAYKERKEKMGSGRGPLNRMPLSDWHTACLAWVQRREKKEVIGYGGINKIEPPLNAGD